MREAAALSFIVSAGGGEGGGRRVEGGRREGWGEREERRRYAALVPGIHNLEAIVEFRGRKDPLVAWDN